MRMVNGHADGRLVICLWTWTVSDHRNEPACPVQADPVPVVCSGLQVELAEGALQEALQGSRGGSYAALAMELVTCVYNIHSAGHTTVMKA